MNSSIASKSSGRAPDDVEVGSAADPEEGGRTKRLASLDVLRGSIVGLSLVLSHILDPSYQFARHAEWNGFHLLDVILPSFVVMYGAGIYVSTARRFSWRRVVTRSARLFVLGIGFNAVTAWSLDPRDVRLTGVLQLFAIVGLFASATVRWSRRPSRLLAAAAAAVAAHLAILLVAGRDCPGGEITAACSPSNAIDGWLIPSTRLYRDFAGGYDPEGIGVLVGVYASMLFGVVIGALLLAAPGRTAVGRLMALGVGLLAVTPLLDLIVPLNKRLWTPAYITFTAAIVVLAAAVLHAALDRPGVMARRWVHLVTLLPVAFGRNSLLVYFGKYVVAAVMANLSLAWLGIDDTLQGLLQRAVSDTPRPALAYMAVMFAAWSIVALELHRRKRYIRV